MARAADVRSAALDEAYFMAAAFYGWTTGASLVLAFYLPCGGILLLLVWRQVRRQRGVVRSGLGTYTYRQRGGTMRRKDLAETPATLRRWCINCGQKMSRGAVPCECGFYVGSLAEHASPEVDDAFNPVGMDLDGRREPRSDDVDEDNAILVRMAAALKGRVVKQQGTPLLRYFYLRRCLVNLAFLYLSIVATAFSVLVSAGIFGAHIVPSMTAGPFHLTRLYVITGLLSEWSLLVFGSLSTAAIWLRHFDPANDPTYFTRAGETGWAPSTALAMLGLRQLPRPFDRLFPGAAPSEPAQPVPMSTKPAHRDGRGAVQALEKSSAPSTADVSPSTLGAHARSGSGDATDIIAAASMVATPDRIEGMGLSKLWTGEAAGHGRRRPKHSDPSSSALPENEDDGELEGDDKSTEQRSTMTVGLIDVRKKGSSSDYEVASRSKSHVISTSGFGASSGLDASTIVNSVASVAMTTASASARPSSVLGGNPNNSNGGGAGGSSSWTLPQSPSTISLTTNAGSVFGVLAASPTSPHQGTLAPTYASSTGHASTYTGLGPAAYNNSSGTGGGSIGPLGTSRSVVRYATPFGPIEGAGLDPLESFPLPTGGGGLTSRTSSRRSFSRGGGGGNSLDASAATHRHSFVPGSPSSATSPSASANALMAANTTTSSAGWNERFAALRRMGVPRPSGSASQPQGTAGNASSVPPPTSSASYELSAGGAKHDDETDDKGSADERHWRPGQWRSTSFSSTSASVSPARAAAAPDSPSGRRRG